MSTDRTDLVIINLKVVAYVQPGERLTMRNNSFSIQQPGWTQMIHRWQYGETRWANLEDIKNVVEDAMRIMGLYMTMWKDQQGAAPGGAAGPTATVPQYPLPTPESCANYINDMVKELQAAMVGLTNLRATYELDPLMVSHLDLLIQRMNDEVVKARRSTVTITLPIPIPSRESRGSDPCVLNAPAFSAPATMVMVMGDTILDGDSPSSASCQETHKKKNKKQGHVDENTTHTHAVTNT